MKYADLHIHTHFSDSTSSPQEVIEQAQAKKIDCIAITDHDTVDGIDPTMEAAKEFGIEVLTGVELSSEINGKDVHILGYLFDHQDQEFLTQLRKMQNTRIERMKQMIEKLKGLGVDDIEFDEVFALAKSDSVGRPHLATIMLQKGKVADYREAFNKYLADWAPAYVAKLKITPQMAIEMIHKAGGVSVLAHPMMTRVDELIPQFVKFGLNGIEAHYPNISEKIVDFYVSLAAKYQLITTGGSDAHGDAKQNTFIGKRTIPYKLVEQMKTLRNASTL